MIELVINNSIQDGTGLSPAYIVYGTRIRMPVDILAGSKVVLLVFRMSKICRRSRNWCISICCMVRMF